MTENAEAERFLSQSMSAALSVAVNIAVQMQYLRADRARQAQSESEQRRRETERQLAAERETAAVLWRKVEDREWVRTRPVEVAEAWASARAWESVDPRAAEARAKFDMLLGAFYGDAHPLADVAREAEDYTALATLVQRAVELTPEQTAQPRVYEAVPEHERRAWLERQVWGPDADPDARIAASSRLADLERGLPVAVLREMTPETRQAWIELGELSPEERRAWRQSWLQRQVWGRDVPEHRRSQWSAALEELERGGDERLEPEAWHAWVAEVRQRHQRRADEQPTVGDPAATREPPARRDRGRADAAPTRLQAPAGGGREGEQERLERTVSAVREVWPREVAEQIVDRPAFAAFAHRLHQLEGRGYDMRDILGMLRADELVGTDRYGRPVRDPAAFAEWHLKQLVTSLPEKTAAAAGIAQLERYVAEHIDQVRPGVQNTGSGTAHGHANTEHDVGKQAQPHTTGAGLPPAQQDGASSDIRSGTYIDGAEPARLAGQSYPRRLNESLKATQRAQAKQRGEAAEQRPWRYRSVTPARTR